VSAKTEAVTGQLPLNARNTIKKIGKHVVSFDENGTIDPLLTVGEAAAILRCSTASLNKWRLTGKGPAFIYVGRRVRYGNEMGKSDWVTRCQISNSLN
jgi:hypothetical protein